MHGISIERLQAGDTQRALRHVAQFWARPPGDGAVRAFLGDPGNVFVVAEVEGRPVGQALGYVLARWDGKAPMLFLYSIDVDEPYRRAGIGAGLVRAFREAGRAAGCGHTFVITTAGNEAAMRLYRSTGGVRPHEDDVVFEYDEP
jgi:ribosomal protein S18 acetylase RimI-like enzyme